MPKALHAAAGGQDPWGKDPYLVADLMAVRVEAVAGLTGFASGVPG